MAKVLPFIPFTNSLGDYSIYQPEGGEQIIIRSKTGPNRKRIKTAPEYARVRLRQSEFGGAGKASGLFRLAVFGIKHLADYSFGGSITKICKILQEQDAAHSLGERSILFSEKGSILNGFNLNRRTPFDSIVKTPIQFTISRTDLKATVVVPQLYPGVNFSNPKALPLFRFIIVLGIIPDMVFTGKGYAPVNPDMKFIPVQAVSEWYSAGNVFAGLSQEINLANGIFLDDSATLVLSIGIEFGRRVSDSLVEAVKKAGSGKVLGVG